MEYLEEGTLNLMLRNLKIQNKKLDEKQAKNLFQQLLDGLQYLHEERVIHCDIHEENIMFSQTSHNGIQLKFVDFGLSKQLDDERAAKQDIRELGSVFNNIIGFTSFSTHSFEIGIKQISNNITNGSYSDVEILSRDLREIYRSGNVYNLFVRLRSGGCNCSLM